MSVAQYGVLGTVVGVVWFALIAGWALRVRQRESAHGG